VMLPSAPLGVCQRCWCFTSTPWTARLMLGEGPPGLVHSVRRSDVRLVLTSNGLITECLRCGRQVLS
jgi:hypothetical protein